jgi:threonine/homoserine efflux transporter RhtA
MKKILTKNDAVEKKYANILKLRKMRFVIIIALNIFTYWVISKMEENVSLITIGLTKRSLAGIFILYYIISSQKFYNLYEME